MIKDSKQILALLHRCRKLRRFYLELTNENFYLADLIKELREALSHERNELKVRLPLNDPAREQIEIIQTTYQKHPTKRSTLRSHLSDACHHLDRELHDVNLHRENLLSYEKALTKDIVLLEQFTDDSPDQIEEVSPIDTLKLVNTINKKFERRQHNLSLEIHAAHHCLHEMRMRFASYFRDTYRLSDESLLPEEQPAPEDQPELQQPVLEAQPLPEELPLPEPLLAVYQEYLNEEQQLTLRINQLQERADEMLKETKHLSEVETLAAKKTLRAELEEPRDVPSIISTKPVLKPSDKT